jgi:8-amino-3,8-dideoxy-alpha-D-manno-octulosonate transaminase
MDRRQFVTAMAAAGALSGAAEQAIAKGTPVRETPLHGENWGPEYYDDKEKAELIHVVDSHHPFRWGSGRGADAPMEVLTFEKEFAQRMNTKYALAVTSGTAALEVAYNALGIGPGDEVILPAWTWHSDATAVVRAGALPVFAEIDESFNIDPDDIEHRITPNTKVLVAVHLQGTPADMDKIMAIAKKHNLKVLEDSAQSIGARYKGRPTGSIGDIGIYSFQESKTITAGEGGAVVTNDALLFERASRFHDLGNMRGPHQTIVGTPQLGRGAAFVGTNFRMNEFTGGVMLAQVRKMDTIVAAVRSNGQRVHEEVRDLPGIRFRRQPDPAGWLGREVFIGFDTKDQCDKFIALMRGENVPVGKPGGSVVLPVAPYIEHKVTVHPAWPTWTSERGRAIQYGAASCPRTLDILSRFAGPAINPKYTSRDVDDIVKAIRKVYPQVMA